jgi:hypothetical protein
VTSPVLFIGETNMVPANATVYVSVLDDQGMVLAQVKVIILGEVGQPGTFTGMIFFSPNDGPGWVTIRETPDGTDIHTAPVTIQSQQP